MKKIVAQTLFEKQSKAPATKALTPANAQLPATGSEQTELPAPTEPAFIELLARSNFSFLQGASHPEEMVEQAIRLNYDGLGLCDVNGLYGIVRGYQTAKSPSLFTASVQAKKDFRYLCGSELVLVDGFSIALMPMTKWGYTQLCRLLTLGKRQAAKGYSKLSLQHVLDHSEDLLAFVIPPFQSEVFLRLQASFGDRLYVPVWKDLTWASQELLNEAYKLERDHEAQLFVTQRPFMHRSDKKPLFDTLTCILHHCTLEEARDKLIQNSERHLRPLEELRKLWKERPDLLQASVEIANRVEFELNQLRYRYPESNLPAGKNPTEYLRELTEKGLRWRFGPEVPAKVRAQIEHELSLIQDLQYEDYFLTLFEICEFAREKKILFQGRGSAANSVVCYVLGLTSVDPRKVDLLFERFISRERAEPPDIDIDFEHNRREEVIQHIYEKYGETHAAMVCTVIRYRSRMAIRETCKVFGIKLDVINAMIKFMGRDGMRRLIEDPEARKRFGIEEKKWKLILHVAQQLHGFPRHIGIHTGGFMITQDPIHELVPVEKATMQGRYVIQWNKDDVNFLGLMKIDVLSLGMLTAIQKAFELLRRHKNLDYNLATLPSEDKGTYDMICNAETVGVFQIESRAQMNTLPRMRPRNFYDLVVEVAIVRPGPLQGGMVHPYLKRRQGLEKVVYPHPDLEPVLRKTLGVPIFQEQVMKLAVVAAGFTPGEADELRRIMSSAWTKSGLMEGVRERIMRGLRERGINEKYSEQIYKTIEGFASYGFPESHAASFALLTYASCYLKHHHPDVFACALLNSQPMGFYPPRSLVADAQRNQVLFEELDVQRSDYDYSLVGTTDENAKAKSRLPVLIGFRSLYGVPKQLLEKIVSERKQNGVFKDLKDFIHRTEAPKALLIKLASAGAFRSFHENPRELIWKIESLSLDKNSFLWGDSIEYLEANGNISEDDSEESDTSESKTEELSAIPHESNWDRMRREYDSKGFSVTYHPMSVIRSLLNLKNEKFIQQKIVPYFHSDQLRDFEHKRKARVAGLVGITQRPPTAKGFCFITMEDEFGFINVVIPPDIYQKYRMTIYSKSLLEIHGHIERSGRITNLRAERVLSINPWEI